MVQNMQKYFFNVFLAANLSTLPFFAFADESSKRMFVVDFSLGLTRAIPLIFREIMKATIKAIKIILQTPVKSHMLPNILILEQSLATTTTFPIVLGYVAMWIISMVLIVLEILI